MITLKTKKLDSNHSLYYDSETNDPVAIVRKTSRNSYQKKYYFNTKWHPDFAMMHPNANDLVNMNFDKEHDSEDSAKNHIISKYSDVINGQKDALPTKMVGKLTKTIKQYGSDTDVEMTHYHVLDNENTPVASMYVVSSHIPLIGIRHGVFDKDNTLLEFHGQKPNDVQMNVLNKKNPGDSPIALVAKVKTWLDSKDKEPKFVGTHWHDSTRYFSTNLSPEKASSEYENYIKNHPDYKNAEIHRQSPTFFIVRRQNHAMTDYVDSSIPNKLSHTFIKFKAKTDYGAKDHNEVIE
jgi:hypothetical protein